jgi:hypothetical protein
VNSKCAKDWKNEAVLPSKYCLYVTSMAVFRYVSMKTKIGFRGVPLWHQFSVPALTQDLSSGSIRFECRSQWPRGLRRGSVAVRLLGLRFRIPPGACCLSVVSVVCCQVEVSGTG